MDLHRSARRFNLVDAMLLVAATAVALAIVVSRLQKEAHFLRLEWEIPRERPLPLTAWSGVNSVYYLQPCLAVWSLALLVLRLRQPRPALTRVVLQPGTIVSVATTVVVFLGLLRDVAFYGMFGEPPNSFLDHMLDGCDEICPAIITAWVILWMSRRLCCEKSWIDRTERVVGILWIVLYWYGWWEMIRDE
jgi:hypothetical protein